MDHGVKKGLMIAGIVFFTLFIIHQITNAPITSSGTTATTSTKTVFVDNDPRRHYYGYGTPANHYNGYKAQYYN
jgi:hypothetical protein